MPERWEPHMQLACALAERGLGWTSPNPVVGCVIVAAGVEPGAGDIVGEGWHERAGGPHAEIMALAQAGDRAKGATAVVTLEPCRHTGRTGPCTEALIAAGVERVVIAVPDPTTRAGGGASVLRAAGLSVIDGVGRADAEWVNRAWLTAVRTARPHVHLKLATSLDGRIAASDGSSRWITGPAARSDVHDLRAASDAVIVGTGTLRADDPHLAVRGAQRRGSQPVRIVLDARAAIPASARVLDDAAPTLVVVADDAPAAQVGALRKAGVAVLAVPRDEAGLDLPHLLRALGSRGIVSLLVEGGPTLAAAMLREGLVDEVTAYVAPLLLGGGASAMADLGRPSILDALRLEPIDVTRIGDDIRVRARVPRPEAPTDHQPTDAPLAGAAAPLKPTPVGVPHEPSTPPRQEI